MITTVGTPDRTEDRPNPDKCWRGVAYYQASSPPRLTSAPVCPKLRKSASLPRRPPPILEQISRPGRLQIRPLFGNSAVPGIPRFRRGVRVTMRDPLPRGRLVDSSAPLLLPAQAP